MMLKKWTILGLTMAAMTAMVTGFAMAQDEDSPLHKIMEQVNSKNLAITKGVRTAVAFKKSQDVVVESAKELVKLSKEARAFKEPSEKQKQPYETWTKLMDEMTKNSEALAKVAAEDGVTQAQAKKAHAAVKKSCTECHNVFRIDDVE
jgi:cytochrome c556